jgi:hypothetical protein
MERAGDLLSSFFDKELLETTRGYSELFSFWKFLIKEQFGSKMGDRVADHSQIKDLEKHILLIETDHPGWIQTLQTKQDQLLEAVRRRFPSLGIRGLSFRLSRNGEAPGSETGTVEISGGILQDPAKPYQTAEEVPVEAETGDSYKKISDPDLKETLKRLEQSIDQNRQRSSSRRRKS